ncbi:hypothetical protein [Vibrio harveyi]|uniref:hypothetical protein n=1 Tax=Vibrio harveyi TaxID=669 RepID=UPI000681A890|nr:hypothetical protein [Vibrio harveyi]PNM43640.1 hypothetical protein AL469_027715 [Vibrio harveyi]
MDDMRRHKESVSQRDNIIALLSEMLIRDENKRIEDKQQHRTGELFQRMAVDQTAKALQDSTKSITAKIFGLELQNTESTSRVVSAIQSLEARASSLFSNQAMVIGTLNPLSDDTFSEWTNKLSQVQASNRLLDERNDEKDQKSDRKFYRSMFGNLVSATQKSGREITAMMLRTSLISGLMGGLQTAFALPLQALTLALNGLGALKFLGKKGLDIGSMIFDSIGLGSGRRKKSKVDADFDDKDLLKGRKKGLMRVISKGLFKMLGKAAIRIVGMLNPLGAIAAIAWTGYEIYTLFEDEFKSAWDFLATKVPEWLNVIKGSLLSLISSGVDKVKSTLTNLWNDGQELMANGVALVQNWLSETGITEFFTKVQQMLVGVWNGMKSFFFNIPAYMKLLWYKLQDFQITLQEGMNEKVNGLGNWVNDILKEVDSDLRVPKFELFDVSDKRSQLEADMKAVQNQINNSLVPELASEPEFKPTVEVQEPSSTVVNDGYVDSIVDGLKDISLIFTDKLKSGVEAMDIPMVQPVMAASAEMPVKILAQRAEQAERHNNQMTSVINAPSSNSNTVVNNSNQQVLIPMRATGESQTTRPATARGYVG